MTHLQNVGDITEATILTKYQTENVEGGEEVGFTPGASYKQTW